VPNWFWRFICRYAFVFWHFYYFCKYNRN